jgi:hypothetical protein
VWEEELPPSGEIEAYWKPLPEPVSAELEKLREVGGAEGGTGTVAWGPLELEVNLREMCITGKTRAVRCSTDTDEVTGQPVGVAKTTQVSPEDFVQDEDEAEAAAKGDKKGKKGKTKGDAAPWYAGKVPDSWAEVSGSA